jgi:hypothetical protein
MSFHTTLLQRLIDSQVLVQMGFFGDQFNLPSLYYSFGLNGDANLNFTKKINSVT